MGMKTKTGKNGDTESAYGISDIVLAKIRGFPAWPGIIVDPESLPSNVMKERPTSKKTSFYCVRFFPAGDYAWTISKDISKLQKHEIEAFINEPSKKNGDLRDGYKVALDPEKWLAKKEEDAQALADAEANAAVDQLDSEGDDDSEGKEGKTKKRKREADAAPSTKKSKAKPKKSSEEPGSKKKATGSAKGKKNGAKSKAMIESEDEGGEHDKPSSPANKKAKKEKVSEQDAALEFDEDAKRVREWRHKLQKTLLTAKTPPKPEDMPQLDELLRSVEQYDNMTIEYLQFSKIGKVMRHIAALNDDGLPRNAEFNFKSRAQTLVDNWHDILAKKKTDDGTKAENGDASETMKAAMDVDPAVPAANGDAVMAGV